MGAAEAGGVVYASPASAECVLAVDVAAQEAYGVSVRHEHVYQRSTKSVYSGGGWAWSGVAKAGEAVVGVPSQAFRLFVARSGVSKATTTTTSTLPPPPDVSVYSDLGRGKCVGIDGKDHHPGEYSFHAGESAAGCEALCSATPMPRCRLCYAGDATPACYGFSFSTEGNCVLFLAGVQGGGAAREWGAARCFKRDYDSDCGASSYGACGGTYSAAQLARADGFATAQVDALFDAYTAVTSAAVDLVARGLQPSEVQGERLAEALRAQSFFGATGHVEFDGRGMRFGAVDLLQVGASGPQRVGQWTRSGGVAFSAEPVLAPYEPEEPVVPPPLVVCKPGPLETSAGPVQLFAALPAAATAELGCPPGFTGSVWAECDLRGRLHVMVEDCTPFPTEVCPLFAAACRAPGAKIDDKCPLCLK